MSRLPLKCIGDEVKCWAILLLLSLFCGRTELYGQQPTDQFESLLAKAQQAQAEGDYVTAADSYTQAIKLQSGVPELWADLGLMNHEAGKYPEAIRSFHKALQFNPNLYVPNFFLGLDLLRLNKPADSIAFLRKAEQLNSSDFHVPITLGRAYTLLGNLPEAEQSYRRAAKISPETGQAWFGLGMAYLAEVEAHARLLGTTERNSPYAQALLAKSLAEQNRTVEAAAIYQKLLSGPLRPPCTRASLGLLHLEDHDYLRAKDDFLAEVRAHPGCGMARLGLAHLEIVDQSYRDGLRDLDRVWKQDHGTVRVNMAMLLESITPEQVADLKKELIEEHQSGTLSDSLYKTLLEKLQPAPRAVDPSSTEVERLSDSAQHDGESLTINRRDAAALYAEGRYQECSDRLKAGINHLSRGDLLLLSECSFYTGDFDTASVASTKATQISSKDSAALYWAFLSDQKLAVSSLEKFERLNRTSPQTYVLLGDAYRQRENYSEAEVEYRKGLALDPNNVGARVGLGATYLLQAQPRQAIAVIESALKQNTNDPELNLLMAEALVSSHEYGEAKPFLQKSVNAKAALQPRVHALLGRVYAATGQAQQAIAELRLSVGSDQDGSLHYQLARLYLKVGDKNRANIAMRAAKTLQEDRRQRGMTVVQQYQNNSSHTN